LVQKKKEGDLTRVRKKGYIERARPKGARGLPEEARGGKEMGGKKKS